MAPTEVKNARRASSKLGDFTMTPRSISISLLAVIIGAVSAFVALGLLKLIGLFTNLFSFNAGARHWYRPPEIISTGGKFWCLWLAL